MSVTAAAQVSDAAELVRLGKQAFYSGNYPDAEQFFRRALEKSDTAQILGDLAGVLAAQEKHSDALPLFDRAVRTIPTDGSRRERSRMFGNLGAAYYQVGKTREAERAFKQALDIAEPGDAYIGIILSNLGVIHSRKGDTKEAEKVFKQALRVIEEQSGPEAPDLVPALINLSGVYETQKKWDKAESLLDRALQAIENSSRAEHPDAAMVLEHLGIVYSMQNKLTRSEVALRRAGDIIRSTMGPESARMGSISFNLAQVLAADKQYDEATALFHTAIRIQEENLGKDSLQVEVTRKSYTKMLRSRDDR
jgi:tetratricopeptide (TPR) repeat protein